MPKRYNTPHRSRVVKTRLSEEEYADFTARLAPYGISQSEFLRQAIRRTAIRPVIHVSAVNDELLSAVGKLTAEYSVKRGPNVKHTAVRPPGGQRFVRVESLGLGYTEAELMQRLNEQRHEPEPTAPVFSAQKRYTIRRRPRHYLPVKRGSFRALYLYYLYLLSPRKRKPQKIPFETRAEIRRAKQYRQQFMLLQKYHIDTKPELEMLSDALSNEMQILVDRRKELYALRREQPSEPLNADIDALTAQLRPLRRELRLCGKIVEYAPRMLRQVQESNPPSTENHAPDKARERRHSLWR